MTRDATAPAATPQPVRAGRRGFALAALAFLKAELGAAQTITTGAGPLASAIEIPVDGSLSNRRLWAGLGDGAPDGICIDADGAVWYGDVPDKRCVRVARGCPVERRRAACQPPARPVLLLVRVHPAFDSLRGDPRLEALLQRAGV